MDLGLGLTLFHGVADDDDDDDVEKDADYGAADGRRMTETVDGTLYVTAGLRMHHGKVARRIGFIGRRRPVGQKGLCVVVVEWECYGRHVDNCEM